MHNQKIVGSTFINRRLTLNFWLTIINVLLTHCKNIKNENIHLNHIRNYGKTLVLKIYTSTSTKIIYETIKIDLKFFFEKIKSKTFNINRFDKLKGGGLHLFETDLANSSDIYFIYFLE